MKRTRLDPAKRESQKKALAAKREQLRKDLGAKVEARRKAQPARREAMEARRKAVAERKKKGARKEEEDPRRWPWLLLLLLLLLASLCFRPCRCDEPPVPEPAPEPIPVAPAPEPEPPWKGEEIRRLDRPEFEAKPPAPVPWIDSFRMQVAARGPRLAECFVGAAEPGRLKWTTSVEPASGRVSQHGLEPMLMSAELTRSERLCVLEVLEDPPYRLEATGAEPSTPSRVGLVIEF